MLELVRREAAAVVLGEDAAERSIPSSASRSSASTRWPRSCSASAWPAQAGCGCRATPSSTTRHRARLPLTWRRWKGAKSPRRALPERRLRGGADRDRRHGLPLPRRRRLAGGPVAAGRRRPATPSRTSPPTAAGTSSASTTPTRTTPAPATPARAASSTTPTDFDAEFFGISPARGAGDGPAAAAAAGDRLGGVRAGRHRPGHAARQPRPASSSA